MKLSKNETYELSNLKRLSSLMEDYVKKVESKHNLAWIFILISTIISLLTVFQIQRYNWAWNF